MRCDCIFADDGNISWYSVCRVLMVEWQLDWEDYHHLTVVGLHDTGPWSRLKPVGLPQHWWQVFAGKAEVIAHTLCVTSRIALQLLASAFDCRAFLFFVLTGMHLGENLNCHCKCSFIFCHKYRQAACFAQLYSWSTAEQWLVCACQKWDD